MPVYKQKQHKSVFNCQTSDIRHNYVMVMKELLDGFSDMHFWHKLIDILRNVLNQAYNIFCYN